MARPASGGPASGAATQTPTAAAIAPAPDTLLRDEQTLLTAAVERLRDTSGMELAAAWALRADESPYLVAAAFEGEPPAAPNPAVWTEVAAWGGAREATPPSPLVEAFPERRAIAAVPIARFGAAPEALLVLASDRTPRVRPRVLAQLDAAARRLATPLAAAHAARRLGEVDARTRQLDRLAALGTVAAELAHEVRNPLVSVKTFLQLLPERRDDPDFLSGFLEVATGELARVERLLGALVAYPRAQGEEDGADAGQVLASVAELLRHLAQARGVGLDVEADEALPELAIDGDALRQALLNLALNAIEVTPAGGRVTLSAQAGEAGVELLVCDTGPGVPESERERIFRPFHSTRGEAHGGLGLSITRRIVEEAGGALEVGDAAGGGAVFRIGLPVG